MVVEWIEGLGLGLREGEGVRKSLRIKIFFS